ncbi:unnamed protein product [Prunus brigantina]
MVPAISTPLTCFPGWLVGLLGRLFGGDLIVIPERIAFHGSEELCYSLVRSDGQLAVQMVLG